MGTTTQFYPGVPFCQDPGQALSFMPVMLCPTLLSQLPPGKVEHVEVVYFHRTQRCASCIEAERLTRKTLDTYFADRLKSGGMSLVVADVQKPQNAALARKYEASGSSLYLGILNGGVEYILPVNDVWLVLQNEAKFMTTLRDKINLVYGGG